MYLAPACFFWLMAGVAVLEWPAMRDNDALQLIVNKPFWYFAAAAMGFCVNLLAYMVIQTASSLTLKVGKKLGFRCDTLCLQLCVKVKDCRKGFCLHACQQSICSKFRFAELWMSIVLTV